MLPVAFCAVGCKLSQAETEALAFSFRQAGFPVSPMPPWIEGPGIVVVGTCTVTSKADRKTRALIRRALRKNPESCVIATGCYAKLDPLEIEQIEAECAADADDGDDGGGGGMAGRPGSGAADGASRAGAHHAQAAGARRLFVPPPGKGGAGADKSALLGLPGHLRAEALRGRGLFSAMESWMAQAGGAPRGEPDPFGLMPEEFSFRSRGYLKVQDGCGNACSYCRARLARGPSASLPPDAALAQARALEERGCAEIVIAGMSIAQYRHSGFGLARLLEHLLGGTKSIALRLSSLEPDGIGADLAAAASSPRVRPHFHISAQSGSDAVLRAMGRAYPARAVEEAAALLRSAKENPFLACDMISGFPGETEADFALTAGLCERVGFAWIHSFPFSPRPGTPAFSLPGRVGEREAKRRAGALAAMALSGRRKYAAAWIGRELSAVSEGAAQDGAASESSAMSAAAMEGSASESAAMGAAAVSGAPPRGRHVRAVSENYLKLLVDFGGAPLPPPGSPLRCVPVSLCGGGGAGAGGDGESPDALARPAPPARG